jgi:hypothetical protein
VAARATANKTTKKKWTNFAGHFDGRGSALDNTARVAQWMRSRALVEATERCHAIGQAYLGFFLSFFIVNL